MWIVRHVVPVLLALALPWLTGCGHHRASCCETGPLPGGETASMVGSSPANPQLSAAPNAFLPSGTPATANSYGGQLTCPVTGIRLGVNGPAIPVAVEGQTIFVCCANCAAKVRANPQPYLAKVAAERAATQPAPLSQLYGGQKHCPVTGEELDPAGGAIPVTVRGQTVYVCCQGCVGKVKKNPDLYLAKVREDISGR